MRLNVSLHLDKIWKHINAITDKIKRSWGKEDTEILSERVGSYQQAFESAAIFPLKQLMICTTTYANVEEEERCRYEMRTHIKNIEDQLKY